MRGAGPVARCGVLASNPGQCCGDEVVRGWRQVAGGAMLMIDRRDPRAEGGDGVGPLPRLAPGVSGIDKVGGDGGSGTPATSRDHSTRFSWKSVSTRPRRSFACPRSGRIERHWRSVSQPRAASPARQPLSWYSQRCPRHWSPQVSGLVGSSYRQPIAGHRHFCKIKTVLSWRFT